MIIHHPLAILFFLPLALAFKTFKYHSYDDVHRQLKDLKERYPSLVTLVYGEEEFNLGQPFECGAAKCRTPILRIATAESEDVDARKRPEVFFSGEIHGNERVGPHAVLELASFLLESFMQDVETSPYFGQVNPWVNRLIQTRVIYLSPITNALGFYKNTREENGIDTNRDYPVDVASGVPCMRTITSRVVNELFRRHMFQLAITFHGGMQAIAYEWGTYSRSHPYVSPDDTAQVSIGAILSAYTGAYPRKPYPHGRMYRLVYAVHGGMEDWAYSASWDKDSRNRPCDAHTYGGYPVERTTYEEDDLRTLNILVETSDSKTPHESSLGDTRGLLKPNGPGNGHVSRNMRLALAVVDLVQPYVQWVLPKRGAASNDMDACSNGTSPSRLDPGSLLFPEMNSKLEIRLTAESTAMMLSWDVGGASVVDDTHLIFGEWDDAIHRFEDGFGMDEMELLHLYGETSESSHAYFRARPATRGRTDSMSGATRWSGGDTATVGSLLQGKDINIDPHFDDLEAYPYQPRWVQCVQLPATPGEYFVMARARVDQQFKQVLANGGKANPNVPPQSNYVNARTNRSWFKSNGDRHIKGQLDWYSQPIKVIVSPSESGTTTVAGKIAELTQAHTKTGDKPPVPGDKPVFPDDSNTGSPPTPSSTLVVEEPKPQLEYKTYGPVLNWKYVGVVGILGIALCAALIVRKRSQRSEEYIKVQQLDEPSEL